MSNLSTHIIKFKDQKEVNLFYQWENFAFFPAWLHGKIKQGLFMKLPFRFSTLNQTSKENQELQLLKKMLLEKINFLNQFYLIFFLKWKKDYHYIRAG